MGRYAAFTDKIDTTAFQNGRVPPRQGGRDLPHAPPTTSNRNPAAGATRPRGNGETCVEATYEYASARFRASAFNTRQHQAHGAHLARQAAQAVQAPLRQPPPAR